MEKCHTLDRVMAEASRCLMCYDAPCSAGCPASTQPGRFIRKLRLQNVKGAIETIKENNALGGVCSVVCPSGELCRERCVATGIDKPVDIGMIQRYLVEHGWQLGFRPLRPASPNGKKVAVVGSGPSGLSCAAELALMGFSVTVFEKMPEPGGMMRYGIPDHRLSTAFVRREIQEIVDLGVTIKCGHEIRGQDDLSSLLASGFDAIYLAMGAWKSVDCGLASRKYPNLFDAFSFLRIAKDDPAAFSALVKGRSVAVIGGGDTAMDAAMVSRLSGAADVFVIYRRGMVEMPCAKEEKEAATAKGINFIILTRPVGYVDDGEAVTAIRVQRTRLGAPDASGRRRPEPVAGSEHLFSADVVVEAIGMQAVDDIKRFSGLKFGAANVISVEPGTGLASGERIFAGGDAVRGPSIVAWAVADGKRAAKAIAEKLGAGKAGRS